MKDRITEQNTSLLIIDVQERLLPAMNDSEKLLENIEKLTKGAMMLGITTMATEQYPKGLGGTVMSLIECYRGNVATIAKTSFDATAEQDVCDWVKGINKPNILVCGMETHICVRQTVKGLIDLGYNPIVVVDCVGSRKNLDKDTAIDDMRAEGICIMTLETVLFEMLRDAKHPAFKEISRLIK